MNEVYFKTKEAVLEFIRDKNKCKKILIIIGAIGVLMILLSEISMPSEKNSSAVESKTDYSDYVNSLNKELSDIISSIDGVGKCKIMITLKNTNEKVFAQNSDNSISEGSNSKNNEYVIYKGNNGDTPILLKENFPDIEGVAVVCSGGRDPVVRENIVSCICALFNIPASRVSVAEISIEG